ncbi:MAG: hypothetical protein P8M80_16415, partial [Pirellulaceae bacterium]|nr:hypothetical protein [Pirellulaceae bacterium]
EMRGSLEDYLAGHNEIANPAFDGDFPAIWNALMVRLSGIDGYANEEDGMFAKAFGAGDFNRFGFEEAATALAAFEASAFGYGDSPFDEYLKGDNAALTPAQKRGALLFYGKMQCSQCHSGTLLTDQQHYNIAVPQFGPGKDPASGLDLGRFAVTDLEEDRFRFRVPGLRNVVRTAPYMHNGAYFSLEDAVKHHLDARSSLLNYAPEEKLIQDELIGTYIDSPAVIAALIESVDIEKIKKYKEKDLNDLMEFLDSLTIPDFDVRMDLAIPSSVPSGLPIDQFGDGN